jgi:S1-C subfamily serine protease
MKHWLTYLLWPALAGFSFAAALLLAPRIFSHVPALAHYLPAPEQIAVQAPPQMVAPVSYSPAIKKAAPAVVSINSLNLFERREVRPIAPNLPVLVAEMVEDDATSLGSGVIISPEGYIVTSYHVFFGDDPDTRTFSSKITVTLSGGDALEGNLIALDEKNDLALLKIDRTNLPFVVLSDPAKLDTGDVVLAIGNPRNIGQSVSAGIVSGLWSRDDSFVVQTDAAINPGNSGGALVDVNGDLIGINSTIVSESGGSEGISFAVAAGRAMDLLEDYLATSTSGYLGVDTNALSLQSGRDLVGEPIQGFIINEVVPGGPADKAGLHQGDIITGVDNEKIIIQDDKDRSEANRAISLISGSPAGKLIVLEIYRDGGFVQLPTILGVGRPNFSGVERIADSVEDQTAGQEIQQ